MGDKNLKEEGLKVIKIEKEQFKRKEPDVLRPPTWEEVSVGRFFKSKPKLPNYLLENLLIKGLVAGIFATGGTGKSYLLLILAFILSIKKNFGPFKPTGTYRVFYLGCEDPEWEIHRRIDQIAEILGIFASKEVMEEAANNLAVYSAVGKIGPIIHLDGNGNPSVSDYYEWLQKTIEDFKDLDVLIIDPMSRVYGLNENDNAHATAFIQCLEKLSQDYDLSIIFAHHESKSASQNKNLRESTGRGASALRDGCRWVASLRGMTDTDAEKFNVNPRNYVEFDISKSNYSPHLPDSIFFERTAGGMLKSVNLSLERLSLLSEILLDEFSKLPNDAEISRNDLQQNRKDGKAIVKALKEFPTFKRNKDMGPLIDYVLKEGIFFETGTQLDKPGAHKKILKIRNGAFND